MMFPRTNPAITPSFPNLFRSPANIPDIAYVAINIGFPSPIIPSTIPTVIPLTPPTNIPFLQPNISTRKIQNMFLIENENILASPIADIAIVTSKLAPTISSIENAFFTPYLLITLNELTNIL